MGQINSGQVGQDDVKRWTAKRGVTLLSETSTKVRFPFRQTSPIRSGAYD